MNILLVDDEIYAVEAIREMVDWKALEIEEVFVAYSMQQAQRVLKEKSVDILLSDIEMPRGSGLELLAWIREKGLPVVSIFLTSHANFSYANQAIRLDTFDYVLKPVDPEELEAVLRKAIDKVKENARQNNQSKLAEYWFDSELQRIEQFVLRVADGRIPADRESILYEAERQHLSHLEFYDQFYVLLIQLRAETENEKEWGKGLTEYGLKNILSEIIYDYNGDADFTHSRGLPLIPRLTDRHYLLFLNSKFIDGWNTFLSLSDQALTACQSAMPCTVTFYPADAVPIEKFSQTAEQLFKLGSDNILYDNTIYFEQDPERIAADEQNWQQVLDNNPNIDELSGILERAARSGILTRTYLRRMFECTCEYARRMLPDRAEKIDLEMGQVKATSSMDGMKNWLNFIFDQVGQSEVDEPAPQDIVEILRRYIREHIHEELGRNELANLVYLNPDYLSHVFREKVGMSLVDFITAERMKKAKELLSTTDRSIRDIALAVGYSNISYFSRQFKRSQGKTPLEFRRSVNQNPE